MIKNILKENMRRFRTKNLNEVNIKQIAQKKGVDLNILKQDKHTQEQSSAGTGNIFYKAVMKSIDDALARQGFGTSVYDEEFGYVSIYPAQAGLKPTNEELMASTLWCMIQPGNYTQWVDGMATCTILPLSLPPNQAMANRMELKLLKDDLIDGTTPKQNSEFEQALIEMKSNFGESN